MAAQKPKAGDEVKRGEGKPRKKNLMLSDEALSRLGLFSFAEDKQESVVVDWLICTHPQLRRYHVTDRGVRSGDLGGGNEDAAPTLPISEALTPSPPESPPPAPGQGRGQPGGRKRTA